jgi:hypothetical protein
MANMHRQVKHTPPVPDLFTTRGDGSFSPPLKRDAMIKNIDGRCVDLNRILSVKSLGHRAGEIQNHYQSFHVMFFLTRARAGS